MRLLLLLTAPVLAAVTSASAQEKPGSDVQSYYPPAALAAGVGGHVWLNCTRTAQYQLKDCQLLEEAPAGQGFGAAALRMAEQSQPNLKAKAAEEKDYRAWVSFIPRAPFIFPDITKPFSLITRPDWLVRPTPQQLAGFFPRGAKTTSGRVSLSCTVLSDTTVSNCHVTEETPEGQGFGEAALKASKTFRMSPQTVDGEPTDRGSVSTVLNFVR